MKTNFTIQLSCFITAIILWSHVHNSIAQIANGYPNDANIQSDPNVIFTEMFEQPTIASLMTNWNQMTTVPANILFDSSVPAGSLGTQSLRLITINDANTASTTANENTFIYKRIQPDITDSVFVRFYIKYDNATAYHHSGVYIGGKNPSSSTALIVGGVKPDGDKEFHVGTEIRGAANFAPTNSSVYGFYNYWMNMHPNNAGVHWGNEFLNSTTNDNINMNTWNCVEVMIKLNNPVTAYNGELALWINGIPISHYGYQFPTGTWNQMQFIEGSGIPFEGFQWRNDNALNINYIWLKSYVTNNINHTGNIYFDHLVIAKRYIGPIYSDLIVPLPIELIAFTGFSEEKNNYLNWTTASETLNEKFEIEHSQDANHFTKIGEVKSQINSSSLNKYSFVHQNIKNGINYYRLRQLDFNGEDEYSKIIFIRNPSDEFDIDVFPIPVEEYFELNINSKNEFTGKAIIYSSDGKIILEQNISNSRNIIQTEKMSSGIYTVKVIGNLTTKILKIVK